MGTNFYARIIPKKERRENLKKLIDKDKFREIVNEVQAMYGDVDDYNLDGSIIHIGKRSGGWKFLWNSNWRFVCDGYIDPETGKYHPKYSVKKYYDLNKKSIQEFLSREDIEMFDEYGDPVENKDTFVEDMVKYDNEPWINGKPKYDGESYDKEEGNNTEWEDLERKKKWTDVGIEISHHEFYSDGLRFSSSTYFS